MLIAALTLLLTTAEVVRSAPSDCQDHLSCSAGADRSDPCCVPTPGGLLVFRQRFEPDVGGDEGSWGIDGMEVLDCKSQVSKDLKSRHSTRTHEEIASACLKSEIFGGEAGYERAEAEWAQSEVGEGVEEVWERAWNTAGRFISTLGPQCATAKKSQEIPEFFQTLHHLHNYFPTADLLSNSDITPASDTTYSSEEIINALIFQDRKPIIMCDNVTLSSVLWPLQVKGKFQDAKFVHSSLLQRKSNCPADGIIYPPSTSRPTATPTHIWDPITRPTPRPITLSHEDSRLYNHDQPQEPPQDPRKLGIFKAVEERKELEKEAQADRRYFRDEL